MLDELVPLIRRHASVEIQEQSYLVHHTSLQSNHWNLMPSSLGIVLQKPVSPAPNLHSVVPRAGCGIHWMKSKRTETTRGTTSVGRTHNMLLLYQLDSG